MKNVCTIATTLAIAAGTGWISLGQPSYLRAADDMVKTDNTTEVRVSERDVDTPAARKAAWQTLGGATEAVLTPTPLASLAPRLAAEDFNRISKEKADDAQLKAAATQFKDAFKAKYNQDFNANLGMTAQAPGIVGNNNAMAAADRVNTDNAGAVNTAPHNSRADANSAVGSPTAAGVNDNTVAVRPANEAAPAPGENNTAPHLARTDGNSAVGNPQNAIPAGGMLDATGTSLTYTLPEANGMKAATIHLTRTNAADGWKIDIGNDVTAQKLADNLTNHLNMVNGMKDQWPADANDAKKVVLQHIAAAFSDSGSASTDRNMDNNMNR